MNKFGIRLKEIRINRNLLQKDLAQDLNLSQSTITNYEKGTRFPNQEILNKIADYFDVSLDYLMGRTNNPLTLSGKTYKLKINSSNPYSTLLKRYITNLLQGKKEVARQLIINKADQGVSIPKIYLHILEPALKKVGCLWKVNEIDIYQEHLFTDFTTQIMYQLHSYFPPVEQKDRLMIAATVAGELHEVGLRIVTDLLELDGWKTSYLGTNTPTRTIINALKNMNADLLIISVTMPRYIDATENLIRAIRTSYISNVKILVGGQAFNQDENLWRIIQADGYAKNAQEAVKIANELVKLHLTK